ncbi:MAG: hypothetical protein D6731_20800 [Planctomycetota bacterium]|nr:MAG: hypothetical protein D6731_20800 [Planctomycetota bacterium]
MSASLYRGLVLLLNLALLCGLAYQGLRAFRGPSPPPASLLPSDFNPLVYEIPMARGSRSSLLEHQVTWKQFDRPKPVQVPVAAGPRTERPSLGSLSEYTLVLALANPRDENSSSVILRGRTGTYTLKVGEKLADGFEVLSVTVRGEGDAREAIVVVGRDGQTREIRYRRSQSK